MPLKYAFELHGGDATIAPCNSNTCIAITDPGNPLVVPLTREQIWNGLLQRVENPLPFLPGLESCAILERTSEALLRELDFGPATIRDRVTMAEAQWVCFDIVPSPSSAGGSLTINIEEPQPGFLFLRFAYRTALASDPGLGGARLPRIRQVGLPPVGCRLRAHHPHPRH